MKKLFLSVVALCVTLFVQAKDYADYVSPLVGTQSSFELSTGNTYPAISRPWGMNFWTPQTGKMGDGWQYVYTANKSVVSNKPISPVRGLMTMVNFPSCP